MKKTATKISPSLEKICAIILLLIIFLPISNLEAKVVRGIVIDNATEKPITGSVVMLFAGKTIYAGVVTDSTGLFGFDNVALDRFYIRVKRIGYKEAVTGPLLMSKLDTVKLYVRLDVEEIQMNEIVVEAKRIDESLAKEGFYERKELNIGHFLTYDDLKKRTFNNVTSILQTLPNILIQKSYKKTDLGTNTLKIYSSRYQLLDNCEVTIYVDGMQLNDNGTIDNLNPNDIAALEFYPSSIDAPMQLGGSWRPGGVLVIWTKK